MGLYNMVFGQNSLAPILVAALGFKSYGELGRFRDAFISEGKIAIYTRNGGGNRESYMPDFSNHPLYLYDKDDDFDCTYATIYFKFPPEYEEDLKKLDTGVKFDPDQRWKDAIAALEKK